MLQTRITYLMHSPPVTPRLFSATSVAFRDDKTAMPVQYKRITPLLIFHKGQVLSEPYPRVQGITGGVAFPLNKL